MLNQSKQKPLQNLDLVKHTTCTIISRARRVILQAIEVLSNIYVLEIHQPCIRVLTWKTTSYSNEIDHFKKT